MAFDLSNFSCGNTAGNAPALHTYKSADTAATANTSGYFNAIAAYAHVGDFILGWMDTGGTPQGYIFNINSISGGVVDVTDGLAIGTTDSD